MQQIQLNDELVMRQHEKHIEFEMIDFGIIHKENTERNIWKYYVLGNYNYDHYDKICYYIVSRYRNDKPIAYINYCNRNNIVVQLDSTMQLSDIACKYAVVQDMLSINITADILFYGHHNYYNPNHIANVICFRSAYGPIANAKVAILSYNLFIDNEMFAVSNYTIDERRIADIDIDDNCGIISITSKYPLPIDLSHKYHTLDIIKLLYPKATKRAI